jgi:hypothetical protein
MTTSCRQPSSMMSNDPKMQMSTSINELSPCSSLFSCRYHALQQDKTLRCLELCRDCWEMLSSTRVGCREGKMQRRTA